MNFDELNKAVIKWAMVRGIFDKSTPQAQMLKTVEELGELAGAIAKGDQAGIVDGLGDVVVTLILQAQMQGVDIVDCLGVAYAEIADRKGKMVDGVFVKEVE